MATLRTKMVRMENRYTRLAQGRSSPSRPPERARYSQHKPSAVAEAR